MQITTLLNNRDRRALSILGLFLLLFFCPIKSDGQELLSWEILADVSFQEKYDEATQAYWLIPKFGEQPKAYQNQIVILEGYFIPVDEVNNFHVLSKYPFASCFFCGAAGPESIVELQMDKKQAKHIRMDQHLHFEGRESPERTQSRDSYPIQTVSEQ